MRRILAIALTIGIASPAYAECDLDDVIGYTLVAKKTVTGRIDKGKRADDYEGCDYGRILILDDSVGLRCNEYNYNYAYRPDAYVFMSGSRIKVCIDGELTDVTALR